MHDRLRRSRTATILLVLLAVTLVTVGSTSSCEQRAEEDQGAQNAMPSKTIEEVMQEHTDEWMAIRGVSGVGIGECQGQACIKVFVEKATRRLRRKIPEAVDGYRVELVESGRFEARPPPGS
jgi:hypothetical protein